MNGKNKTALNTAALSKKYRCDVNRLIRLWKSGLSDFEISQNLGIDLFKVLQIRQEIAYLHERERQLQTKLAAKQKSLFIHSPRH